VWSAGDSFCPATNSPPSQRATNSPPSQSQSSTDSRTFSKERGRETRHTRQHASLSSLRHAHPPDARPRALSLVWSAGNSICGGVSICGTTSSPPSQRQSSTDSRTFGNERGRETRHARQHASLPSLHAAGVYIIARIPLSCVVRRSLDLGSNGLVALPAEVFNGLTSLT
jgi:hypothetical protein